jgi:hypothetical protein
MKPIDLSRNPAPFALAPGASYKPTTGPERDREVARLLREARACGEPIDAAIVAPCEREQGHAGPCRAFSLEVLAEAFPRFLPCGCAVGACDCDEQSR